MSESQKLFITAAAHQCEAALLMGNAEVAALASEFAFFIAGVEVIDLGSIPTGDHWV